MKVFVSSVIGGFEEFRATAAKAVQTIHSIPILSEQFGARPYASKHACLTEIEQSDVFVLMLGARYGFESQPNLSVTQQEFRHAAKMGKPILVFVQDGVNVEEKQSEFKKEVENFHQGFHRESFTNSDELSRGIIGALVRLTQVRQACTQADFEARLKRMPPIEKRGRHNEKPGLKLAFLPQPSRSIDVTLIPLDEAFKRCCDIGLSRMRDGYEAIESVDATGLTSGRLSLRYFNDGLVSIESELGSPDVGFGFANYYVSPTQLKSNGTNFFSLLDGLGGWYCMILGGMENRVLGEPRKERINSFSMPMRKEPSFKDVKFMSPCNARTYEAWLSESLRRMARTFPLA